MQIGNRQSRRTVLMVFAALLALFSCAQGACAADAYFVLMFAGQRIPNDPDYSHSYATFVRATWDENRPNPLPPRLEAHTISWLPANMKVRTYALLPECGHNFDLHTTVRWALGNDMRTSLWGPYQIDPQLYGRAIQQISLLQSGKVLYKANDLFYETDKVSNCIHAVGTTVGGHRVHVAVPGWGETASYALLLRLDPFIIDRCRVHPWVGSAVGLDQYPIYYRDWAGPRSGAFFGPVYRLFGGERDLRPSYGPPVR
jgi:hypothetical protein